jgi:hypothetical protein
MDPEPFTISHFPRLRLGHALLAVALIAALLTIARVMHHASVCTRQAEMHAEILDREFGELEWHRTKLQGGATYPFPERKKRIDYHEAMREKWRKAATRPWGLVVPDPPAPR